MINGWEMVLIARYGEIFLKGSNRVDFERKLAGNIQKMFSVKVWRKRNRLLVEEKEGVDLRRVFGLISYSPAVEAELDMEKIKEAALGLVQGRKFSSFAVAAKRMGAGFLSSKEMNEMIGKFILEKVEGQVDLKNPELVIGIEIIDGKAYIFTETTECLGGLPVGVEGKAGVLVEDEDSLLAGLLIMKRGCGVVPIGFDEKDISLLQKFSPEKLKFKKIKTLEAAGELANALVVGNKGVGVEGVVVLKPLVGLSQEERSKKISIFKRL